MPGLGTSYGRGGATSSPKDLLNSDAILIMGSNMAENHPVGFQWVMEAKENGAQLLHVDPRFSRTSAVANIWVPLRAGSDILFLGAMIHYVLEKIFGKETLTIESQDYSVNHVGAIQSLQRLPANELWRRWDSAEAPLKVSNRSQALKKREAGCYSRACAGQSAAVRKPSQAEHKQ